MAVSCLKGKGFSFLAGILSEKVGMGRGAEYQVFIETIGDTETMNGG